MLEEAIIKNAVETVETKLESGLRRNFEHGSNLANLNSMLYSKIAKLRGEFPMPGNDDTEMPANPESYLGKMSLCNDNLYTEVQAYEHLLGLLCEII
jgi:hypothetical protein